MLVVIASIMILTVLVTDIGFASRVRFLGASHERDQHEAYWLANTGANVYRLLLIVNKQLATQLGSLTKNLDPASSPMGAMLGLIDAQDPIVSMVPMINSGLMRMVFAGDGDVSDEDAKDFAQTGQVSDEVREKSMDEGSSSRFDTANFLDFDGDFMAEVKPEDCRINVNRLSSVTAGALMDNATAQQIYAMMSGEENETWLRERNLDRWDLIGNLADWVDVDGTVATGKGGYEDGAYSRMEPPMKVKNAPFDTPSEIRLVDGWQDDVYDRFGKELTIFGSGKVNINCASDDMIKGMLRAYAGVTTDSEAEALIEQLHEYKTLNAVHNARDFKTFLENEGRTVDAKMNDALTDRNTVYTITSLGTLQDASAKITVVVNMKTATGKVVYYRVD